MTTPFFDLMSLTPLLRIIARGMLRSFPSWQLDHDDFVQIGLLGALSVRPQPDLSAESIRRIRVAAARYHMINAMRTFHDPRSPQRRKRGLLRDDIVREVEIRQSLHRPEEAWASLLDLQALAAQLAPRERRILQGRLEGKSYEAIGLELGRSQGQIYKYETSFRHRLREIKP